MRKMPVSPYMPLMVGCCGRLLRCIAGGTAIVLLCQPDAGLAQTINLSPVPPAVSIHVEPNIAVTLDDSGSMIWTHLGDVPKYSPTSGWFGAWRCAAVVDPTASAFLSDGVTPNPRAMAMNGVYYNPNITYLPPLYEDGTSFPNADATLLAVPVDGIAINRPTSKIAPASSANFWNNIDLNGTSSDSRLTNMMNTDYNAWNCGTGVLPFNFDAIGVSTSMSDSDWPESDKPGGPYYYVLNEGVQLSVGSNGALDSNSVHGLYTTTNWHTVKVPPGQYQNFANWYAYYRTRSTMARTVLSRVFGAVTAPLRVVWQNLGLNSVEGKTYKLSSGTVIQTLDDSTTDPVTGKNYRAAFYNWLFNGQAGGATPSRDATIRVGEFFQRGFQIGNSSNPYWQPAAAGQSQGSELACRQNFHMLVTDGFYNDDAPNPTQFLQTATSIAAGIGNNGLSTQHGLQTYQAPLAANSIAGIASKSPTTIFNGPISDASSAAGAATMSNIAFHYWATNLRPDFQAGGLTPVSPHIVDLTTGVTDTAVTHGADIDTPEVFWNPANDPASWPHLVQFMVTLGAAGTLNYSTDIDCTAGSPAGNDDLCKLRTGLVNSTRNTGWPQPNGAGEGVAANVDDLWHAALNSRGGFFVANDPDTLVKGLTSILNSIVARSASITASVANSGIAGGNSLTFETGFSSADWSGTLSAVKNTQPPTTSWQASIPSPDQRVIFSSSDAAPNKGIAFAWTSLSTGEAGALSTEPVSGKADSYGALRLAYIRGDQSLEVPGSVPLFRARSSVLGAIVDSQPMYVAFPDSAYIDAFPAGSPEALAAAKLQIDSTTGVTSERTADVDGTTYEQFTKNHANRQPMVYVGANDGMLHAFNASNGHEMFDYIPATLYPNLPQLTPPSGFIYTNFVDNTAIHRDVFSTIDKKWHTLLIGTLRLGGRGVFALDITNPTNVSEGNPTATVLWEFNNYSSGGSNSAGGGYLDYTYGLPNIARTPYGWVVIVPSGYEPECPGTPVIPNCTTGDIEISSFFIFDAMSGNKLAEIRTPNGAGSYGLGSVAIGGSLGTPIESYAFAGDLVGNLWRLDMSNADPARWVLDLVFTDYTGSSGCAIHPSAGHACSQPITSEPALFPSSIDSGYMVVFGTGQYLSPDDASNVLPQAFYGISEAQLVHGVGSPIRPTDLVTQTLSLDDGTNGVAGLRELTNVPITAGKKGWTIPLSVVSGERVLVKPAVLVGQNAALLATFTPGSNSCGVSGAGALMLVSAANGGPVGASLFGGGNASGGTTVVGANVNGLPMSGVLTVVTQQGGGNDLVPGITLNTGASSGTNVLNLPQAGATFSVPAPLWRRRSWRTLFNDL